ncbi:hypothetical protein P0E66_13095 [Enterococcus faecalis]|uniref:hypothetical protein n=1 Tax=Enterococcus faecalis TaxID=1351 RepID=UPI001A9795A8|nr:hypothetical protein [Enterococcus faecalis]MBO1137174.1 hypothetical protein [Enterococcus faecalis]MDN3202062.1 hypothetical protein [Enterococcus faecalis]
MQDKRKLTIILVVGVISLGLLLTGLIVAGRKMMREHTTSVETSTISTVSSERKEMANSSIKESTNTRSESTSTSISKENNKSVEFSSESKVLYSEESREEATDKIKKFLMIYFTWELTPKSINDRSLLLKEMMNEACYSEQKIETDSELLKEMVQIYEKKKEINTSNSIQLITSRYLSSQIYQDMSNSTIYHIKVKVEQQAPYQEKGLVLEKEGQIQFINDQVVQIKVETSQK